MLRGRHVEVVVVDHHDALLAATPHQSARNTVATGTQGDQVDEVGRRCTVRFTQIDAALFCQLRSVDVGDLLLRDRAEVALQRGQREDASVVPRDVALGAHLELAGRNRNRGDERREQSAQHLGQRQERTQRLVRLGGIDVDSERHEVASERQLHHVGDGVAGLVLRLAGAGTQVRRDDDGRLLEQRRGRGGFSHEHVDGGASNDAVAHAIGQRLLVDDATTGNVDDPQRRLRLQQQIAIDETRGLLRLGQVDGEEVGFGHSLVERQQFDTHLASTVGRHERVVRDQAHSECTGTVGDQLADTAKTDDGERLVGQLDTFPAASLPPTSNERCMGLGHVACLRQQQRHRVLGGRDDVALRRVDHHHSALGRLGHVDVVEADTGAADHHERTASLQHFRRDLGGAANDQGMCTLDDFEQPGEIELHIHLVPGRAQPIKATFGDFFGDEDACHASIVTGQNPRSEVH